MALPTKKGPKGPFSVISFGLILYELSLTAGTQFFFVVER